MLASNIVNYLMFVTALEYCRFIVCLKCIIDINKDFNNDSPLFLKKVSLEIIYPDKLSPNILSFNSNEEVIIHCFGGSINIFNVSVDSSNEVLSCKSKLTFKNPSKKLEFPFDAISCSKNPEPITKEDNATKCKNGVVLNVGYQVIKTVFKKTIDLCHVKELATTLWAHATIPGSIGGNRNRDFSSPAFLKGSYFDNVVISQVYPKSDQQETFLRIFNNNKDAVEKFLPQHGERRNYLVRGHLIARADMFYAAEQWSTYAYINVLPMWQSINNANWKSVEMIVRRVATMEGDLDVWTGGIGILKLLDREIFLSHDKHDPKRLLIPVPELLFKLVHNPRNNTGLAFVTVNNPYVTEPIPDNYKICLEDNKTCNSKNFPQFKHAYEGYTYCCPYNDFMSRPIVKNLTIPAHFLNVRPLNIH